MLKLYRVIKVEVLFLVLVYVFNFNLFEFWAAILEKGLFNRLDFHCSLGSGFPPQEGTLQGLNVGLFPKQLLVIKSNN